ncbi:uncharacterized protein LOC122010250 isoform X1 [Zingiber officinale]|uniref:uncharacterized protein LOC122010250 isoform X1 n=1 Tax=Zingiber officinale TaxID=94328 RepID=UPI001C4B4F86|nr:uncharacterized protein LOC122010250 isoform X1 [Zingiber officinale]XP_042422654.1 uncharacterized protein LOC122010250 isoform X1 [Zingiber officinale]XP_042422655.1 uncharacterized protein LOC122010250 isoform X1 [Zingiber officinale]XP_042422656.1 uncharacterized protein LOC122010250 isoform X1 [Zingiber officinale]XP_042422657.1 uncharacterized protein LOC122010250 isoform X1 [Zingiber officinale]XP_042422658.1 uncharacterized protein LOC122010250 isoform X1 [Zingiber officinale]
MSTYKWISTNEFDQYLESVIWPNIPQDRKQLFNHVNSYVFSSYVMNEKRRKNLVRWFVKQNPFSTNYFVIPVCIWSHWNVVILCNLGTEDGRIIILDSLIDIGLPSQQEPWIRRILLDVYKEAERPEDEEFIYNIPLHVPHMPQQKNAHECGVYALYFIFLLVRRGLGIFLPEKQNNNECHDWFWIEEYYRFKKEVCSYRSLFSEQKQYQKTGQRKTRQQTKQEEVKDDVEVKDYILLDEQEEERKNERDVQEQGQKKIKGMAQVRSDRPRTRSQLKEAMIKGRQQSCTSTSGDDVGFKGMGEHHCVLVASARSALDIETKHKIHIQFNGKGKPNDKKSTKLLSAFLRKIATDAVDCPLDMKWTKMPIQKKQDLWAKVQEKFLVPKSAEDYIMRLMANKVKHHRRVIKASYYKDGATREKNIRNQPNCVLPEQWANLVDYWSSDSARELSRIRKLAGRNNQPKNHNVRKKNFALGNKKVRKQSKLERE